MASPLFGKLPAELRAIIFTDLFGNRRVHLEFMAHPTRADKVGNRKRWRHGICEDGVSVPFSRVIAHHHYCLSSARRRALDTSLLWTCRRALLEGVPVLYQSNTFLIVNAGSRRPPVDDNQASMVPHLWSRDAYEAFWDALSEMPALSYLRVAPLMPRCPLAGSAHPPPLALRECYLTPIVRLKRLKVCEIAMPESFRPVIGPEDCSSITQPAEGGQYTMSWVDDDTGRVPVGPAMARTIPPSSFCPYMTQLPDRVIYL
ncbi:hypothetical protein N658DRAFT_508129 [Parathielavia hyrcaniae]|uniref:DUF7730 domain-containing protein n=1 Tax=Parathielavia hyrcaniae TaxID=113614 RepID=A0AAN6PYL9_9PEZI|nr:hypothetical protein N658DRAFT_508129 [Parathielavia hyrcaniae]